MTVIPCSISPRAVAWVTASVPNFATQYGTKSQNPCRPAIDPVLMILPPEPWAIICLRGLLGADDHAPGVDADDLVEVRLVDVHEVARTVHPGVVEDHVELAERVDRRPDHGLHLGAVGDVDADGRSAAAARRRWRRRPPAPQPRRGRRRRPSHPRRAIARHAAAPIPPAPPVTITTRSCTRPISILASLRQATLRARAGRRRARRSCRRRGAPRPGTW